MAPVSSFRGATMLIALLLAVGTARADLVDDDYCTDFMMRTIDACAEGELECIGYAGACEDIAAVSCVGEVREVFLEDASCTSDSVCCFYVPNPAANGGGGGGSVSSNTSPTQGAGCGPIAAGDCDDYYYDSDDYSEGTSGRRLMDATYNCQTVCFEAEDSDDPPPSTPTPTPSTPASTPPASAPSSDSGGRSVGGAAGSTPAPPAPTSSGPVSDGAGSDGPAPPVAAEGPAAASAPTSSASSSRGAAGGTSGSASAPTAAGDSGSIGMAASVVTASIAILGLITVA